VKWWRWSGCYGGIEPCLPAQWPWNCSRCWQISRAWEWRLRGKYS